MIGQLINKVRSKASRVRREIFFAVPCYFFNIKIIVCISKVFLFHKYCVPRKPCLVDLHYKTAKEFIIVFDSDTIMKIMVHLIDISLISYF